MTKITYLLLVILAVLIIHAAENPIDKTLLDDTVTKRTAWVSDGKGFIVATFSLYSNPPANSGIIFTNKVKLAFPADDYEDTDIIGYRVFCGLTNNYYTRFEAVPPASRPNQEVVVTFTNLVPNTHYFFIATAELKNGTHKIKGHEIHHFLSPDGHSYYFRRRVSLMYAFNP